ncbi:cation-translocating P-type ATPase [Candidatus Harpocratesius sp.]
MAIAYYLNDDTDTPAHMQTVEGIFKRFHSSSEGLSTETANLRLKKAGSNKIPKRKKSFYQKYIKPVVNLMMLILFIAALVQIFFYYEYNEGSLFGPVVIIFILLLNLIIGMRQQYKAEKTLDALEKLTAFKAKVLRDGHIIEISTDRIVPGDIMILSQGDFISADGRLIEVNDFSVNESILTGETNPVNKIVKRLDKRDLALQEQINMVFNSTFVASGNAKAVITATGIHTEIGKISKGIVQKEKRDIPLQHQMNKLATGLGLLVLVIIVLLFLVQYLQHGVTDLISEISWLIYLAVAAIPLNFPIITTLILLTGVIQLARKQAIVRNLNSVETMGRLTYICTDKTGTLTKNEMTVQQIYHDGKIYHVDGIGYKAEGKITLDKKPIDIMQKLYLWKLISIGAVNNNAQFQEETIKLKKGKTSQLKVLGMPTEGALLILAEKAGIKPEVERSNHEMIREISFSSERKCMTKIIKQEDQVQAITKGAVEVLLSLSSFTIVNGEIQPLTEDIRQEILKWTQNFAKSGLRTLGFAYSTLHATINYKEIEPKLVEKDLIFLGFVGILDPPREGVPEAVKICQDAGIKVVMITGDHPMTALAIAKKTNIYHEGDLIASGHEIRNMDIDDILKTTVFSRVAPEDKEIIVKSLQSKNQIVAMTGDGVNDALALENADVGIAMGLKGTDVAKNAADLVLTDDSFKTIETALYHGRGLYNNIRSTIVFLLIVDLMELSVLTTISLLFGGEFLNSFQLLILYASIHFFPPIGLIFDKYSLDLMKEPPKKVGEPLITRSYKFMMFIQIIFIALLLIGIWHAVYKGVLPLNSENLTDVIFTNPITNEIHTGYTYRGDRIIYEPGINDDLFRLFKAQSMCFISLFMCEIWVALECNSNKRSLFKNQFNFVMNILLWFSIAILIFLTQNPVARAYLNIVPLSKMDWIIAIGSSFIFLFFVEIIKAFLRKNQK